MKSANSPTVPFFPTGRAFFIYIGEHEARKGENTNMKSPRAFWKCSRKTQHLSGEAKWFWVCCEAAALGGEWPSGERPVALAGRLGAAVLQAVDERGKGKRLCNCSKSSWNFSVSFVSKQENKCWRSLPEKGKPQAVLFLFLFLFSPYGGTAVAVSQPFPSVFFGSFYLVATMYHKNRRELLD